MLVLDDDDDVRMTTVALLDRLGYRTIAAADPEAADRLLDERDGRVDLLLSDVVLGGSVDGPKFAREARRRYPDLPVLFMSGHAFDRRTQQEIPESGDVVLLKPIRRAQLAGAVRETLAGNGATAPRRMA